MDNDRLDAALPTAGSDTTVYWREDIERRVYDAKGAKKHEKAFDALGKVAYGGGGNVARQMRTVREQLPVLLDFVMMQRKLINDMAKENREMRSLIESSTSRNTRKRWTKEDDEALIEQAADGDSLTEIAISMGRTPTAIQTRISYLVGKSRLTKEVAGKFIGTLDGKLVEGDIEGTVSRYGSRRSD